MRTEREVALDLIGKMQAMRAQKLLASQMRTFEQYSQAGDVSLLAPSKDELRAVLAALAEARDAGLHHAWIEIDRVVNALPVKSAERKRLESLGEAVKHAMGASFALAT